MLYGTGSVHVSLLPAYVQILQRQLRAEVQVVLSEAALRFVSGEALHAFTARPVRGPHDGVGPSGVPGHVELSEWADLLLVLPATANTLAKMAGGFASDLGSATILAASCPVIVAPAMRRTMWESPAVARNLAVLEGDGMHVVQPQACPAAGQPAGIAAAEAGGVSPSPARVLEYIEGHRLSGVAS